MIRAMHGLPPYAEHLGIRVDGEEAGMPRLACDFGDQVLGRPGFWHGGALSGLLEMAAVTALLKSLGDEEAGNVRFKPVNATVDFMRGGGDRTAFASGRALRVGRTVATIEAFAWQDGPDRPIAMITAHYLLKRPA